MEPRQGRKEIHPLKRSRGPWAERGPWGPYWEHSAPDPQAAVRGGRGRQPRLLPDAGHNGSKEAVFHFHVLPEKIEPQKKG